MCTHPSTAAVEAMRAVADAGRRRRPAASPSCSCGEPGDGGTVLAAAAAAASDADSGRRPCSRSGGGDESTAAAAGGAQVEYWASTAAG